MNPLIQKQFYLEAWEYNQNLEKPFPILYDSPRDYYYKCNYLKFDFEFPSYSKHSLINNEKQYTTIVERDINEHIENKNKRDLTLSGEEFLKDYFPYFFNKHPELQLDLLKFFPKLQNNFKFQVLDFVTQQPKEKIEEFLTKINHWLPYSIDYLAKIQEILAQNNFSQGFRVKTIKSFINQNAKVINKNAITSSLLEDFLYENYPKHVNEIACNIVAIQKRQQEVNFDEFDSLFKNTYPYCFTEKIDMEKMLKTFQISNWSLHFYFNLVNSYHSYLTNKFPDISIFAPADNNSKNLEIFVKMKEPIFTIEEYKKDLFSLFSAYRNNRDLTITNEHISKILLNAELSNNLNTQNTKKNKFKV